MAKRFAALLLALILIFTLTGCAEAVGEAVGNVAEAAKAELEKLMQKVLEKYKITPVEIKSAAGKLNDASDSDTQFFCAALIKSNSNLLPKGCAAALGALFEDGGVHRQTTSSVDSVYLVHKSVTFDHSVYDDADYYVLWVYTPSFKALLPEMDGLSSVADSLLEQIPGLSGLEEIPGITDYIDMDSITSFGGIG